MSHTSPPAAIVDPEKLAALKELAYGASHEINNPLANIAARAQTLLRDEVDLERRRALEAIHAQAMRAHEMISDLMLFARPPELQRAPTDLAAVVRQVVEQLGEFCQQRGSRVQLELPAEPVKLDADAAQLAEAIRAALLNALESAGIEGCVTAELRTRPAISSDRRVIELAIADDGPGLDERSATHAFDPFFSGREAGRGLGFGLSKCWRIVTAHGGDVQLAPGEDGGAVATITLPVEAEKLP